MGLVRVRLLANDMNGILGVQQIDALPLGRDSSLVDLLKLIDTDEASPSLQFDDT